MRTREIFSGLPDFVCVGRSPGRPGRGRGRRNTQRRADPLRLEPCAGRESESAFFFSSPRLRGFSFSWEILRSQGFPGHGKARTWERPAPRRVGRSLGRGRKTEEKQTVETRRRGEERGGTPSGNPGRRPASAFSGWSLHPPGGPDSCLPLRRSSPPRILRHRGDPSDPPRSSLTPFQPRGEPPRKPPKKPFCTRNPEAQFFPKEES